MKPAPLIITLMAVAVAAVLLVVPSAVEKRKGTVPRYERIAIELSRGGRAEFNVEVAETRQQQERGLMLRNSLPSGAGMLFVYERPQSVAFWMKNTLIPLDIIFIRPDGTIAGIKQRAVPLDETKMESGEPVSAVLEINGGEAERLGIRPGDRVLRAK